MSDEPLFDESDVIFRYTRKQALEDGVLVDLTSWAKELGFVYPVACTAAVWQGYVVPDPALVPLGQSERGRGHDLLWMLRCAIQRAPENSNPLFFEVLFLMPNGALQTVQLKSHCGPGDAGEPVLTILLPEED